MSTLHVLSTKKLKTAVAEQLKQAGISLTEKDFIRIDPAASDEAIKQFIDPIDTNAYVIFTSSNAVDAVADHVKDVKWKVFCISGKTREAVREKLKLEILATADTGVELAKEIIEHGVKQVVFFSGNIRRKELPQILDEAGVMVKELTVYKTVAISEKINNNFDAVFFFSPSAVKSFFSQNQLSTNTVCFAIGNTTAKEIQEFSSNKVIVAETPTQEAIVNKLINHYKSSVQL